MKTYQWIEKTNLSNIYSHQIVGNDALKPLPDACPRRRPRKMSSDSSPSKRQHKMLKENFMAGFNKVVTRYA
ncbi:hypothetical protein ACYTTR_21265, partial [Cobetia marina]